MEKEKAHKVTGMAQYTGDISFPGMVRGKVLRSPYAHARIVKIDVSKAEATPGVVAVLTREDLQNIDPYYGLAYRDRPILAMEKVRHEGEPVVAIAADDEATALEALANVEVEYEPLPAALTIEEALAPGAPQIHEEELQKALFYYDLKDLQPVRGTNVCHHNQYERGDIEKGMAMADHIIEGTFSLPPVNHYPLEPFVATADFQGDYLQLWSSAQAPFHVRQELSEIFGLPMSRVRVMVPLLGGGFGAKAYTHIEPLAAALSMKARRPVQLALSADETFQTIARCALRCHMRTGVKSDGTLVAWEVEFSLDCGAYSSHAPRLTNPGPLWVAPYRVPHVRVKGQAVYTNTVPNGVLRGAPAPFMGFPRESQMDIIAHELGIDPIELRLKNALDAEEEFGSGSGQTGGGPLHFTGRALHFDVQNELRKVAQALEVPSPNTDDTYKARKKRGTGVACGVETTPSPTVSSVVLTLSADGSLRINASVVEMGQGAREMLSRIASEELGIPMDHITMTHPDTEVTPYEQITSASRTTINVGRTVERAAQGVRTQLSSIFSQMYEVDPDSISLSDGHIHGGGQSVSLGEIVAARHSGMPGGEIVAYAANPGSDSGSPTQVAVAGAEVEVDEETGRLKVLKFVSSLSVGKIMNGDRAHGQNEGGTIYALGHAISEEMLYNEDGQLTNGNLMEYVVPTFDMMPEEFESILVEDKGGPGPGGARGIGEAASLIVMPAIVNAVYDATGVRHTAPPLTPQHIMTKLRQKTQE